MAEICAQIKILWIYTAMKGMQQFLLMLATFSLVVVSANENCIESFSNKLQRANCQASEWLEVPRHCNPKTQILDLSYNQLSVLTSDSFISYPDLQILFLRNNLIEKFDNDVFASLTKLHTLYLDYNIFEELPDLPCSLVTLNLTGNYKFFKKSSISKQTNLKSLEKLRIRNARLTEFPKLGDVGNSLVELELRRNGGLTKFGVADLAPLCKLKELFVGDTKGGLPFVMEGDGCDCQAVQKWINKFDIRGTKITCKNENVKCGDIDLSQFESVRTNCQSIWKTYCSYRNLYIFCAVLLSLCFIIALCCIRCRRQNRRAKLLSLPISKSDPT